ncbi:MAG: NAD(P)-dependent oxidoreductase, partial [Desulfomonilia bacterium]
MKILITGSRGLLGQEVAEVCRNLGDEVLATDIASPSAPLDITSPAAVRGFLAANRPDWVVNCAAFTDVDGCEEKEDLAFELNARAPGLLARACEEHGAKLLHVSTDYVFDGEKLGPYEEDDAPNPLSVYGKSKRAGEISIQEGIEHYLIIRPQWLFGSHGRNFVSTILG